MSCMGVLGHLSMWVAVICMGLPTHTYSTPSGSDLYGTPAPGSDLYGRLAVVCMGRAPGSDLYGRLAVICMGGCNCPRYKKRCPSLPIQIAQSIVWEAGSELYGSAQPSALSSSSIGIVWGGGSDLYGEGPRQ